MGSPFTVTWPGLCACSVRRPAQGDNLAVMRVIMQMRCGCYGCESRELMGWWEGAVHSHMRGGAGVLHLLKQGRIQDFGNGG